jgi:hypothetical protein
MDEFALGKIDYFVFSSRWEATETKRCPGE